MAYFKDLIIKVDIVVVDGIIECECDHLRHDARFELARNLGAVMRTEAIRKNTLGRITRWSSVRILKMDSVQETSLLCISIQ